MLKTDRQSIKADGRDVSVITVEVQDNKGRVVPDACPMLMFRLEGDGRIIGVGNGDPAYLGEDHPKDKDCHEFSRDLHQWKNQPGSPPGRTEIRCE